MDDWDEYRPVHAIRCSWCDARLGPWRGWDGPVRRLVWREGERRPIRARDGRDIPPDCADEVLPARFVITARCEGGHVQHAACTAIGQVWGETVRMAEQWGFGEYQPDYVLDYGLPSVDPLEIGPGEAAPLAALIAGRLGAVLYLSRRSLDADDDEPEVDWIWEIELCERNPDGGWGDGDWNWDPWPDPNIELQKNGPAMLLSDLRGIVTPERAQYVIGGMASVGVDAVEIRSTTDRRRAGINRNRAFLLELPDARTSLTLAALDGNDDVITGPSGSLAVSFVAPREEVRQGTTWTTVGVLPPVLRT